MIDLDLITDKPEPLTLGEWLLISFTIGVLAVVLLWSA